MLEPEPPRLIWSLFGLGALAAVLALVAELGLTLVLLSGIDRESTLFRIIQWFIVAGLAEESCKFLMLWARTWRDPNFDCLYDGLVYAVAVSAGFALLENILYLIRGSVAQMFLRAIISVPSHICFAVFMGTFYSAARRHAHWGEKPLVKLNMALAVIVPAFVHGLYDFVADGAAGTVGFWAVVAFAAAMFIVCFMLINRLSGNDEYIANTAPAAEVKQAEAREKVEEKLR